MRGRRQPKHRADRLGPTKARRHVDGGAIGQRYHGADAGDHHQAPAQPHRPARWPARAAVQDPELFAKHPPDNEQRFRPARAGSGEFSTSSLMRASNLTAPAIPTLRPKLRESPAQVVVDGNGASILKQLAMRSAASAVSGCATSSHAPDGKAPPASSAPCRGHR